MTASTPTTWIVGHDGSAGAARAVEWALAQAQGRAVDIMLLRAWQLPAIDVPIPAQAIDDFAPLQVCGNLDEVTAAADQFGVALTTKIEQGGPSQTLLHASEDAALLVVGSRGLGGFRRLLLGSVSSQCATHARVPTVVVPPTAVTDRGVRRIVVGLDGSDRAIGALDWALDFAPDGCEIVAVGAWHESRSGYVAVVQEYAHEIDQVREHFDAVLDAVEAETDKRLVRRFVHAAPAKTLLAESSGADLLVVGQRGHSGLSAAVLGSVTTHVLHHSDVPVVVVPDAD